jgi:hypothetical protein
VKALLSAYIQAFFVPDDEIACFSSNTIKVRDELQADEVVDY